MATSDPVQFPEPEVPIGQCDQALGVFMRAWDQLELALFALFHKLLATDVITATILFHAGIDLRTMRGILTELGKHRLKRDRAEKLGSFMRRVKNAATKRNRIIHGNWVLMLEMGPPPRPKPLKAESAHWVRQYHPSDSKARYDLNCRKSQKAVAAYEFTPNELIKIAQHTATLAKDLQDFRETLHLVPVSDPLPIEW